MNIVYDPKKIIIHPEIRNENGEVIQKEYTLADHHKECSGCAYCD